MRINYGIVLSMVAGSGFEDSVGVRPKLERGYAVRLDLGSPERYLACMERWTNDAAYRESRISPDCYSEIDNAVGDKSITVWFVRHGKSLWNERHPVGRVVAASAETVYSGVMSLVRSGRDTASSYLSGYSTGRTSDDELVEEEKIIEAHDQVSSGEEFETPSLVDARLSRAGVEEAMALASFLSRGSCFDCPPLEDPELMFATSNLRRAAMTLAIGFEPFLENAKVHVLSSVQEKLGGPDANSLAEPGQRPAFGQTSASGLTCPFTTAQLTSLFDPKCNLGSHHTLTLDSRQEQFCNWMYRRSLESVDPKLVVVGHSHWFSHWLRAYEPFPEEGEKKISENSFFNSRLLRNTEMIKLKVDFYPKEDNGRRGVQCIIAPGSAKTVYPGAP